MVLASYQRVREGKGGIMIKTISVAYGDAAADKAAQQYALTLARAFDSVMRLVACGDSNGLLREKVQEQVGRLRAEDMHAEIDLRPEGIPDCLLKESRECDLLVVGAGKKGHMLAIMRNAECSVMTVEGAFGPIRNILVDYQGGIEGKTALRIGGHLAERTGSALLVLSVEKTIAMALELTDAAEKYLGGFDTASVETLARENDPESEKDVLSAAENMDADMIVIGREPAGLLENLFDRTSSDAVVPKTKGSLLIAR
jgi:nucleotide-binding universal stress UspA family protein